MITSKSNDYIKHVKLLAQKKYRDEFKEYIIEGQKLVLEALENDVNINEIIVSEDFEQKQKFDDALVVSRSVFEYVSDTKTPQGVLAVALQKVSDKKNLGKTIMALDDVQDPGNLGTIIRTLDAAGIDSLILSKGCADVYNPKVVRSTMGAIFRVDTKYVDDLKSELLSLKEKGYNVITTSLKTNKYIYDIDFSKKTVIVIGNESNGVSKEIFDISDEMVKIPMLGKTESLNASVAAGVIIYECVRQKRDNLF